MCPVTAGGHFRLIQIHFCVLSVFSYKIGINSKECIELGSSDSQIDKPQRGRPKRADLRDVNINTSAQSINTERASLMS